MNKITEIIKKLINNKKNKVIYKKTIKQFDQLKRNLIVNQQRPFMNKKSFMVYHHQLLEQRWKKKMKNFDNTIVYSTR